MFVYCVCTYSVMFLNATLLSSQDIRRCISDLTLQLESVHSGLDHRITFTYDE